MAKTDEEKAAAAQAKAEEEAAAKAAGEPDDVGDEDLDQAKAETEAITAEEQDAGFRGTKVDPFPNEAHSLESGPDAPSPRDVTAATRLSELSELEEAPDEN